MFGREIIQEDYIFNHSLNSNHFQLGRVVDGLREQSRVGRYVQGGLITNLIQWIVFGIIFSRL